MLACFGLFTLLSPNMQKTTVNKTWCFCPAAVSEVVCVCALARSLVSLLSRSLACSLARLFPRLLGSGGSVSACVVDMEPFGSSCCWGGLAQQNPAGPRGSAESLSSLARIIGPLAAHVNARAAPPPSSSAAAARAPLEQLGGLRSPSSLPWCPHFVVPRSASARMSGVVTIHPYSAGRAMGPCRARGASGSRGESAPQLCSVVCKKRGLAAHNLAGGLMTRRTARRCSSPPARHVTACLVVARLGCKPNCLKLPR